MRVRDPLRRVPQASCRRASPASPWVNARRLRPAGEIHGQFASQAGATTTERPADAVTPNPFAPMAVAEAVEAAAVEAEAEAAEAAAAAEVEAAAEAAQADAVRAAARYAWRPWSTSPASIDVDRPRARDA